MNLTAADNRARRDQIARKGERKADQRDLCARATAAVTQSRNKRGNPDKITSEDKGLNNPQGLVFKVTFGIA